MHIHVATNLNKWQVSNVRKNDKQVQCNSKKHAWQTCRAWMMAHMWALLFVCLPPVRGVTMVFLTSWWPKCTRNLWPKVVGIRRRRIVVGIRSCSRRKSLYNASNNHAPLPSSCVSLSVAETTAIAENVLDFRRHTCRRRPRNAVWILLN